MSYTLDEMITRLPIGMAFKRNLYPSGGWEYVRPINEKTISHTVAGHNEYGGYGGQAELDISVLDNGHWASDGWIPE